jgi:lipoprotein-releasing system ATP-binding protein
MLPSPILSARGIRKTYSREAEKLEVLKGLDLDVAPRESLVILGASGAGKSTFLQILGALDRPDSGEIFFQGQSLQNLKEDELAKFRNQNLGFVFQSHHLMAELTALENVMLPARILRGLHSEDASRAEELLAYLGLGHRKSHYPAELSGGELQRVSIARALMNSPQVILADEPTGNLDSANSLKVQDLFFHLQEKFKVTLIVVTHDLQFASRFPRMLKMRDGAWAS